MTWFVIAVLFALAVLFAGAVVFSSKRNQFCRRCGDRVSPEDARAWCLLSRCPHQRAPDPGDVS